MDETHLCRSNERRPSTGEGWYTGARRLRVAWSIDIVIRFMFSAPFLTKLRLLAMELEGALVKERLLEKGTPDGVCPCGRERLDT